MNYLHSILKQNWITKSEFAEILGIERSHCYKLTNGKRKSYMKTIKFLAEGLERIDGTPWQKHADNIYNEIYNIPVKLRVVGGTK